MLQCFQKSIVLLLIVLTSRANAQSDSDGGTNFFKHKTKSALNAKMKKLMARFENDKAIAELHYTEIEDIKSVQKNGWVKFNLPEGKNLKVKTKDVKYKDGKIKNWFGRDENSDRELVSLTFVENGCRGFIKNGNATYEVYPLENNMHALVRWHPKKGQECLESFPHSGGIDSTKKLNTRSINPSDNENKDEPMPNLIKPNNGRVDIERVAPCTQITSTVHVLVYFTPNAAMAIPGGNVQAVAENSVAQINQALATSGVPFINAQLIDVRPFPGIFTNAATGNIGTNMTDDLTNFRTNGAVIAARGQTRADVVMLLTDGNYEEFDPFTGQLVDQIFGAVPNVQHPSDDFAFLISDPLAADAENGFTVAHEFAHLFGARHQLNTTFNNRGADNDPNFTGHGHSWSTRTTCIFRAFGICFNYNYDRRASIVHQRGRLHDNNNPASEYVRILRYSNPNVNLNGTPTGTNNANNANRINGQFATVAANEQNFSVLNIGIDGDYYYEEFQPFCLEAVTSCGQAPFTFQWEVSNNGFIFSPIGNTEQICVNAGACNSTQHYNLTVTDALGTVRSLTHTIYATGSCNPLLRGGSDDGEQIELTSLDKKYEKGLYPNPATDNIQLSFSMEEDDSYAVSLFDLQGRLVKQLKKEKIDVGTTQNLEISVTDIPNGLYILKISGKMDYYNQKVIVNH
jgi:hypothetical protein